MSGDKKTANPLFMRACGYIF